MAGLEGFARDNSDVADYQVISFLNVENTDTILGGNTLADSLLLWQALSGIPR